MEYVPARYRGDELVVGEGADLLVPRERPTVVRNMRVIEVTRTVDGRALRLSLEGVGVVTVRGDLMMRFGDEEVSVFEYFLRAFEINDLMDFVLDPQTPDPVAYLWVHIEYDGAIENRSAFSLKDDGLFALRAKAGEKAERKVMADLSGTYGHEFPISDVTPPGRFIIRGAGKGTRRPDLVCLSCGLRMEVKRRNKDTRYRVSHSSNRPFSAENDDGGWHCFVFPNGSLHYVSNRQILSAFDGGRVASGADRYDGWADLADVTDETPPCCPGATPDDSWVVRASG